MPNSAERVSFGDATLDALFQGGLPRNSSLLVHGANGTGKTSLGMQFLQTGLDTGETCVFVTTDGPIESVRRTVDDYDWALDRDGLTTLSVSPTTDPTNGSPTTLSVAGEDRSSEHQSIAATVNGIADVIGERGPVDRVVVDTVSALVNTHTDAHTSSTLLALATLFNEEYPATTLYTATNNASITPLPDRVDGTLTLQRTDVAGDSITTAQIHHVAGVDYDSRIVELQFGTDGITAAPTTRALPEPHQHHDQTSVGIPNLNTILGGGLITGASTLLRHDGNAHLEPLIGALLESLHDREFALTVIPPITLRPSRFAALLDTYDLDMQSLLTNDELYIIDFLGAWDAAESNVYGSTNDRSQLEGVLREVDELSHGRRATIATADVLAHSYDTADVRELRYHQEGQLLDEDDVLLYLQNPNVVPDTVAEFFVDSATQVMETWLTDDGRQYLSLEASPTGAVGTTTLLNHVDDHPYVSVQPPPHPDQYSITSDISMWEEGDE